MQVPDFYTFLDPQYPKAVISKFFHHEQYFSSENQFPQLAASHKNYLVVNINLSLDKPVNNGTFSHATVPQQNYFALLLGQTAAIQFWRVHITIIIKPDGAILSSGSHLHGPTHTVHSCILLHLEKRVHFSAWVYRCHYPRFHHCSHTQVGKCWEI